MKLFWSRPIPFSSNQVAHKIQHEAAGFEILTELNPGDSVLSHDEKQYLQILSELENDEGRVEAKAIKPNYFVKILTRLTKLGLEKSSDGSIKDIKIRLAGSSVTNYYGSITGKSIMEIMNITAAERGWDCALAAFQTKRFVLGKSIRENLQLPYREIRVLLYPLYEQDKDEIVQLLALFSIGSKVP